MGKWGEKPDKGSIDEKPPNRWGGRGENRKIIKYRYCQWKNLLSWTKDREGKTEIGGERKNMVWLIKDLNNKELRW